MVGSPSPARSFAGSPGPPTARLSAPATLSTPVQFELTLRRAERELAAGPLLRRAAISQPPAAPPALGDKDSFNVCATADCITFVRIGATVKYAGNPGVIYQDDHQLNGAEQL